jgi:hypothetical protein
MEINNFSEFLLEKKKNNSGSDDSKENSGELEIWKPGGGTWFLEYYSQIKSEKDPVNIIKVTEEVLLKLAKEGFSMIDSSLKWEKLYQFAKYCLKGEKFNYPASVKDIPKDKEKKGSKTEPGILSEILELEVEGKTIDKILGNDIKNDDLESYTDGIYLSIKKFIKESPKAKILFNGKNPSEFDDLGVISLLAGLYQPKNVKSGKPIFITESTPVFLKTPGEDGKGWNGDVSSAEVDLINSGKKVDDWKKGWSIPIEPLRVRNLMQNAEICVKASVSCIKQISDLFPKKSQVEADAKILEADAIIKKIEELGVNALGPGEEETGLMYPFWAALGATGATDAEKITLIEKGTGFTNTMHVDFIKYFDDVKVKIQEAKDLVDSGEMTSAEYESNVKEYTEDEEGKNVAVGEGLRKVMYEEIKDGISDLQAAVDNYSTAPGEKNALDQFLKVYNEFIGKAKSKYTITIVGDIKKLEVKKK